jgi:hypothetical protein
MRWLAAVMVLVAGSAAAQVPALLVPTPLGTIISVYGYLSKEQKKIYYARVQSQGATQMEARNNGFRLAVEQAIGPLILSESESQNSRLKRDQIITYSAGMVDRFEIQSQTQTDRGWSLVMDVWVTHSDIAGRLLGDSTTSGNLNGDQLGARVQSLLTERNTGDQVVTAVARDYAARAYDIELRPARVEFDAQRQVQITVPFVIDMNYAYAVALYDSMNRTGQAPVRCLNWESIANAGRETPECQAQRSQQYHFTISMKPADRWQFWNGRVTFDDPGKLRIFAQAVATPLALSVTLLDTSGQIVARVCQDLAPYTAQIVTYNQQINTMIVQQGRGVQGEARFNFSQDHAQITRLGAQQARVMPQSQCRT